ncbi:MAG: tetratricopeptide repeat protein [Planctomycetia bacterium]|nr:tetratricopeptide repeat protein [Planctomycetia bacterium]
MPIENKRENHSGWNRHLWRWLIVVAILVLPITVLSRKSPPRVTPRVSPPASYDMAMQYLATFRVDEAERVLTEILASHPESVRVRDELRWMYFNQFRGHELESLLEDGLRVRPHDFSLAVDLLMSEFRPQNPREVLGYWERAASHQPEQARVLATLGYCYARVGDTDRAEQAFQSAVDLSPRDALVRIRAAEFLIDRGDWSSAGLLLNLSAPKKSPDSQGEIYWDQVLWNQSLVEESRGDIDAALDRIERALERRPSELRYVHRRGALLQLLGRSDEAAACFVRANQLESYIGRLTEIVLSGELENPTRKLCDEITEICQQRGKTIQAETWKRAAAHAGS